MFCGDNKQPVTFDEYTAAYQQAWCEFQVRCGVLSTVEYCLHMFPPGIHPDYSAAVADSLVIFHADVADACIEWLENLDCDLTLADATCYWFDDCAEPLTCDISDTGTCIEPKADGERCDIGGECASGSCSLFLRVCTSQTCI